MGLQVAQELHDSRSAFNTWEASAATTHLTSICLPSCLLSLFLHHFSFFLCTATAAETEMPHYLCCLLFGPEVTILPWVPQLLWLPTNSSPAHQAAYLQSPSKCQQAFIHPSAFSPNSLKPSFIFCIQPSQPKQKHFLVLLSWIQLFWHVSYTKLPAPLECCAAFVKLCCFLKNLCKDSAALGRWCSILKDQRAKYKKTGWVRKISASGWFKKHF